MGFEAGGAENPADLRPSDVSTRTGYRRWVIIVTPHAIDRHGAFKAIVCDARMLAPAKIYIGGIQISARPLGNVGQKELSPIGERDLKEDSS